MLNAHLCKMLGKVVAVANNDSVYFRISLLEDNQKLRVTTVKFTMVVQVHK